VRQIRDFTDLPIILILTHRDGGHVGGASQFNFTDIYMNMDDYNMTLDGQEKKNNHFTPTHDLQEGDTIDLGGGTVLEAINIKGHIRGSTVLWDRYNHALYTGDAMNRRPWVFLERSVPLEGYLKIC
jgi:glyoxylase-like metal-dependent hydrolase (beta-lactamase superfamily II)